MSTQEIRGSTALVTGASSGLGSDFARELASRGCNLILVARRKELLDRLRDELASTPKIKVDIVAMDLNLPESPQLLYDRIKKSGNRVDILINNAGFGLFGEFAHTEWESQRQMLNLDIIVLVQLTKLFLGDMLERDSGFILQIASIGAFQPSPLYAAYSAAKAFVLSFGEALSYELKRTHVGCTVLSPGVTKTDFLKIAGQRTTFYQRLVMMKSPRVVKIGVNAMLRRKPSAVAGFANVATTWLMRILPRRAMASIAFQSMKER